MNKKEFLDELRRALTNKVSTEKVNETVAYYEEYITSKERDGQTQEEVIEQLGAPQLIATSVIDASNHRHVSWASDQAQYEEQKKARKSNRKQSILSFFIKHPIVSIIILIVGIILLLIVGIWLAISFLSVFWPIILFALVAVAVAVLIINLIKLINSSQE